MKNIRLNNILDDFALILASDLEIQFMISIHRFKKKTHNGRIIRQTGTKGEKWDRDKEYTYSSATTLDRETLWFMVTAQIRFAVTGRKFTDFYCDVTPTIILFQLWLKKLLWPNNWFYFFAGFFSLHEKKITRLKHFINFHKTLCLQQMILKSVLETPDYIFSKIGFSWN